MDMEMHNISEAKAQLSAIIARVQEGEEFIIAKAGKPVAKVVPYERKRRNRRAGLLEGQFKIPDDFDEWPEDIARALGIID